MRLYELLERRDEEMKQKLLALINHSGTPHKEREAAKNMLVKLDTQKDRHLKTYGDQGEKLGQNVDIKV